MRIFLTLLCKLVVSLVLTSPAYGQELAGGFAAIEEGDDRIRPGLMLHMAPHPFYAAKFYHWGRDMGAIKERSYMLSVDRRWATHRSKFFEAAFGAVLLDEQITIDFESNDDFDTDEHNYNLGGHFGMSMTPPIPGPLFMSVSWDSHVFLAGQGGLFLATGRKMSVSLIMGAKF
jgi:hypothetical protein